VQDPGRLRLAALHAYLYKQKTGKSVSVWEHVGFRAFMAVSQGGVRAIGGIRAAK
jgi:hypothetical protein